MAGLRLICKAYGSMKINGTLWLWDYAKDEPVLANEMRKGSPRYIASEVARLAVQRNALICAARGCEGCIVCEPEKFAVQPNYRYTDDHKLTRPDNPAPKSHHCAE